MDHQEPKRPKRQTKPKRWYLQVVSFRDSRDCVTHIAFSSDSNHLALAHADRSLCLYRWKVGVEEMGLFLILLNLSSVDPFLAVPFIILLTSTIPRTQRNIDILGVFNTLCRPLLPAKKPCVSREKKTWLVGLYGGLYYPVI